MKLKVIFAGTPEIAVPALQKLLSLRDLYEIVAVYTQPDRKAGRGQQWQCSAVKTLALEHGIPVEQPESLGTALAYQRFAEYAPDVMVVMAYGLLLPNKILTAPRLGCINIHVSLLPRWRGAAPIQYAILNGDVETGVSIIRMVRALDAGDILAVAKTRICDHDTQQSLGYRLSTLGADLLESILPKIASGSIVGEPQDAAQVTYASKIAKQDAAIDCSESAEIIDRKIRAYEGWPVAFTAFHDRTLRLWQARPRSEIYQEQPGTFLAINNAAILVCGDFHALELQRVQLPGKPIINGQEFSQIILRYGRDRR